ncbi:phage tail tape measure protein [Thioalkalivibrio sp. ALMg9]|uniref:phage tail tape measure protein n=1 Tax=Thioalkalivibrio sp. ALMg9 TaxID=1266912 RepID=UPI000364EEDD|nr:phage tail tape measure protein [Thioalkalivibrio sp. ALMg9]
MSELRASVVMDLQGNLQRQARRYEQSMAQLSQRGSRHMSRLSRVTGALGRGLDRIGNRWTALATGAAGIGTLRSLGRMEERFARLGIQSQRSAEDMERLRRQIFDTARAPDIRVDPSEITSAIESIIEKTGDLQFAEDNLRNIAAAISATGAEGTNIGEIMAEFQKMDVRAPEQVLRAIDTLNEQGKEGAFTLQNLAALGPRVVTAYSALGRQGPEALREMGAALQVIRQGTGSSEQAATAFEALLRTFQDADRASELQRRSGVQIFDPDELERGREVLRPINELMSEIVEAAGGRTSRLSEVFDAQAMRAFNSALAEYNRTGAVESLDRFLQVQGDGTATFRDSERAAQTSAAAMRNLASAWNDFADQNLSGPIQAAADALNSLDKETVDRWFRIGGAIAGIVASAYAIRSVGRLGRDLTMGARSVLGGGMTTGGVAGGLGGAASRAAPTPVYVVNWGGMPGGGAGRGGGAGGTRRSPHQTRRPGRFRMLRAAPNLRAIGALGAGALGTAGLAVGAAGAGGYGAGTMINRHLIEGTETGQRIGDRIGWAVARVLSPFSENARNAVRVNEGGESRLTVRIDQDGRVRSARPERGDGGPEIDVDVGGAGMIP